MKDRSVRSLIDLEGSASTARVLNLRFGALRMRQSEEPAGRPFFQNPRLNISIILKHRLRGNEVNEFREYRQTATKILFPIDPKDLRVGARYIFVGQKNFLPSMHAAFGALEEDGQDLRTLNLLDELPSLDPFLLREQLKRHGIEPDLSYFDISEADSSRMSAFVERELGPLLTLTFQTEAAGSLHTAKFAHKLLSATVDADLEPLRATLQLDEKQYSEGVFCWKAFLYYKWQLSELLPKAQQVLRELGTIRPVGPMDSEAKAFIASAREQIRDAIAASCRNVQASLKLYDIAYRGLTGEKDPRQFRDFLLRAPDMFRDLGERLAGIEHVVSFWRFRFPDGAASMVGVEELIDILMDFANGLGCTEMLAAAA
jgi:hypothetical protein